MRAKAIFKDRVDAGEALAEALQQYRGRRPLVLAIPRGGLPIADVIAQRLEGDLDVVLVHKLGAPFDPEFAIGAIDETGWCHLAPGHERFASGALLEQVKAGQLAELHQRRMRYTPFVPRQDARGRIAIVVDDGLATGATMTAALHAVRAEDPVELVCAVPVGAADSLARVRPLADETVCLLQPPGFGAVSHYYRRFDAVDDDEAAGILRAAAARRPDNPGYSPSM